ncbi:TPA: sodium ion-translocating decarboxylase subunit beta [Streptococcus pyogenes]|nr:sodium ion-translocating decarboxylase subunit beta [Streptococcus pyogenes]HEP3918802.1 sodium ion-translocating decarboxylase subunit beta [Streptococcus pyogenes]
MDTLIAGITSITIPQIVMMVIGALLMYLGIKKEYEPTLLVPMGLGTILVNFPGSGVLTQVVNGVEQEGVFEALFNFGIGTELFPLLIFIGIGAMIDFGLLAFIMDSIGGVMFAKFLNLFRKEKINPMIGAAGISAFPMSSRVIQKMATDEDPQNFILMYAVGANVSGQIASVIAGGLLLAYFS